MTNPLGEGRVNGLTGDHINSDRALVWEALDRLGLRYLYLSRIIDDLDADGLTAAANDLRSNEYAEVWTLLNSEIHPMIKASR